MKNKLIISIVTVGCAVAVSGVGQTPRQYPALRSGANQDVKPAAGPAAKAASPAKNSGGTLSDKDKSFMKEAANGGMMEVDMGQMASQKGQSAEVKKIGQTMVTDHTKANNELMSIAQNKGVKLTPKKMSHGWKSDSEYLSMMVADHQKDLNAFQTEAQNGSDPDVKKFAQKTSAVIRKHLAMVQKAQSKGGGNGGGATGAKKAEKAKS